MTFGLCEYKIYHLMPRNREEKKKQKNCYNKWKTFLIYKTGHHNTFNTNRTKEGKEVMKTLTVVVQCSGEQQDGAGEASRTRHHEGGEE